MVDVTRDGSPSSDSTADLAPNASAGSASVGTAGNALRLIATVGSPIAIGTGLLFYFGWVRASVQAKQLGYDTAILGWSIQDYILRSINVLFIPLMALAMLMLLLVWLHQRLILPAVKSGKFIGLPQGLTYSWILWISIAIALALFVGPLSGVTISASITLALLSLLYGDVLKREQTQQQHSKQEHSKQEHSQRQSLQRPPMSSAIKALVLILLGFSVFWNTERLARIMGEAYAAQIKANPRQLLAVTVYSQESLAIEARGVVETKVGDRQSAYRYRYDGLRLVQRSSNGYLLMTEVWDDRSDRIIVLRDTDTIRLEFKR